MERLYSVFVTADVFENFKACKLSANKKIVAHLLTFI